MTDPAADWFPLDPDEHERQLAALRRRLAPAPRRVLDVGAGDGRIARPLAADGHTLLALDRDPDALRACAAPNITTILTDVLIPDALATIEAPIDAALCLGHTFLLFADPDDALALLRSLRPRLAPRAGFLAIDAFPRPLWREVADGNWQEGLSQDGFLQLLWAPGDNVIALREGDDVRPDDWTITPADTPLRLWTLADLALLARLAGYDPPEEHESENLILFRPRDAGDSTRLPNRGQAHGASGRPTP